jgi:hypothetical protein
MAVRGMMPEAVSDLCAQRERRSETPAGTVGIALYKPFVPMIKPADLVGGEIVPGYLIP